MEEQTVKKIIVALLFLIVATGTTADAAEMDLEIQGRSVRFPETRLSP